MRLLAALALATLAAGTAAPVRADDHPAATRRFMRDLVSGKLPWASVVDPARGVAYLRYTSSEDDPPRQASTRKLCGAEVRFVMRKHRDNYQRQIEHAENFGCRNRGATPRCWIGDIGEFAGTTRFEFHVDGDRLVLDAIAEVNSVYPPDDEAAVLTRLRARADAKRCTP